MTACSKWHDELMDAALGGASQDLQAHLNVCAACAAQFSKLQAARTRMDAALAGLRAPEGPSENFLVAVKRRVEAQPRTGTRRVVWQLAAAAVLLIIFAGAIAREASRREERELVSAATAISEWRSPTESLLCSPATGFLQGSPRLGETYFPIDTTAAARRAGQIRRKS